MKLNFSEIKLEFFKYLAQQSNTDIDLTKLDDVSIFSYSDDFKDFVSDKYGVGDSIFSLGLNDILSGSISDGKFVGLGSDNQFAMDYINDLLGDENVQKAIDENGDGKLSNEEIENFFTQVSNLDGNADDVSSSDVENVFAQIQSGNFKLDATKSASKTKKTSSSGSRRTSSPTSTDPTNTDPTSAASGANLTSMSVEQLNNEKANALAERDAQYDILNQINNGEGPVAEAKGNVDKSFANMQRELTKLDSELAEELSSAKTDREAKEQAYNENETAIAKKTAEKSDAQADLDNANSNIASIQSCIDGLNSQMSSAETDEEKAKIQGKINEANSKLQQAEAEKQRAEEALNQINSELQELTGKSSQLKADFETAKARETEAEGKVDELAGQSGNKTLKYFKDAYDTAKTNFESAKTQAISDAKNIIKEKQEYIGKINAQIPETQKTENERSLKAYLKTEDAIVSSIESFGGNTDGITITQAADGSYNVTEITKDGVEVKYTFDEEGNMTSYQNAMGTFKADGDKVTITNENHQLKHLTRAQEEAYTINASLEDVVSQMRKSSPYAESFISAALNSFKEFPGHGTSNYCVRYADYVYNKITGNGIGLDEKAYADKFGKVDYDDVQTGDIYQHNVHIGMVLSHIKDRNGQNVYLTADYSASGVTLNIRDENDGPKKNGDKVSLDPNLTNFYRGLRVLGT